MQGTLGKVAVVECLGYPVKVYPTVVAALAEVDETDPAYEVHEVEAVVLEDGSVRLLQDHVPLKLT